MVALVAVAAEVMVIVVSLEGLVVEEHEVCLGRDIGDEDGGDGLAVRLGLDGFRHVVQQRRHHQVVALARARGPRRRLHAVGEQIDRLAQLIASLRLEHLEHRARERRLHMRGVLRAHRLEVAARGLANPPPPRPASREALVIEQKPVAVEVAPLHIPCTVRRSDRRACVEQPLVVEYHQVAWAELEREGKFGAVRHLREAAAGGVEAGERVGGERGGVAARLGGEADRLEARRAKARWRAL
mmetsp:Transcript_33595/g.81704  ORF Transcript_33595/g.81704 Transcript_33595/m.81704 type:complete len:242 (-) Transcript_33595:659-1384(-)